MAIYIVTLLNVKILLWCIQLNFKLLKKRAWQLKGEHSIKHIIRMINGSFEKSPSDSIHASHVQPAQPVNI